MPKVNAFDVIKYVVQGMAEDITRKKASRGVGKWNDLIEVKKKKDEKKAGTPNRMSMSPRRAIDIKRKAKETAEAGKY